MGGKQSTAARSRGPFPGVSTDDSAVPPPGGGGGGPPPFGHYRAGGGGGAMGLRSRSVSSVAGMGMDPAAAGAVPFGLYAAAARAAGEAERAPGGGSGGGGPGSDSTYAHGNGYQETGGGHHRDGMLYLGARASLADALPLHIAPRWFSSHSGECRVPGAFPRFPFPPWVRFARRGVRGRWGAASRLAGRSSPIVPSPKEGPPPSSPRRGRVGEPWGWHPRQGQGRKGLWREEASEKGGVLALGCNAVDVAPPGPSPPPPTWGKAV